MGTHHIIALSRTDLTCRTWPETLQSLEYLMRDLSVEGSKFMNSLRFNSDLTEIFAALLYAMTWKSYVAFCDVSLNKDTAKQVTASKLGHTHKKGQIYGFCFPIMRRYYIFTASQPCMCNSRHRQGPRWQLSQLGCGKNLFWFSLGGALYYFLILGPCLK